MDFSATYVLGTKPEFLMGDRKRDLANGSSFEMYCYFLM